MKAVFLDRDGVVVADRNYQFRISDMEILEGVPEAIISLNEAGFQVIIVSNQSGVARGYFSEKDVRKFNDYLASELKKAGARIDGMYYCPHHPTEAKVAKYRKDCDCRKPKPGMLLCAARDHNISLPKSWVVGDKDSDIGAGKAAGCRTIFVGKDQSKAADFFAKDLKDAVARILS